MSKPGVRQLICCLSPWEFGDHGVSEMETMQNGLAVFYHVWFPVDSVACRPLLDEQLKSLGRSGLPNHADVFCCIAGDAFQSALDFVSHYPWVQVIEASEDNTRFEGKTLQKLFDLCASNGPEVGVAYMHTEGISALTSPTSDARLLATNSWRHSLEWRVIDRWRKQSPTGAVRRGGRQLSQYAMAELRR